MATEEELTNANEATTEESAAQESETAVATESEAAAAPASNENFTLDLEEEEEFDSLTFSNGVIEKIVALAVREVPQVLGMKGGWVNRIQDAFGASALSKGVTIEPNDDGSLIVNVSVFVEYGSYAPDVFDSIKKAIVDAMDRMTGLEVAGVNLNIADVLTPEEAARMLARNNAARLEAPAEGDEEPEIEDPEVEAPAELEAKEPAVLEAAPEE